MSTTHLKYPIIDKCPCGKVVGASDRQELVFSNEKQSWMRACADCLNTGRKFISENTEPLPIGA